MEHLQKAALSLHGMHASDRKWMLEQMPSARRELLVALLDELEELGVPREPMLLEEVTAAEKRADENVHPLVDRLRQSDVRHLCDVLEAEPDAVTIGLVTGAVWPWTDALLEAMPTPRRAAIKVAVERAQALPGRAFEALCESTLEALQQGIGRDAGANDHKAARQWRLLEKLPWRR